MAETTKAAAKKSAPKKVKSEPKEATYSGPSTKSFEWEGHKVNYVKTIGIADAMQFVENVIAGCFVETEEGGHEDFRPETKDFLIRENIVRYYTDVSLPDDANLAYLFLYDSNFVDVVLSYINPRQIEDIAKAIDEKCAYRVNTRVEYVNACLSEVQTSLEEIAKKASELFAEIDMTDLTKLVAAATEGKFDEEKLVSAYLEGTKTERVAPGDTIKPKATKRAKK